MSLRWELTRTKSDSAPSSWVLRDDQELLAILSVTHPEQLRNESAEWQRVEIAPETWLIFGATLELLPGIRAGRLSHLQLPPLNDGQVTVSLPPLP